MEFSTTLCRNLKTVTMRSKLSCQSYHKLLLLALIKPLTTQFNPIIAVKMSWAVNLWEVIIKKEIKEKRAGLQLNKRNSKVDLLLST